MKQLIIGGNIDTLANGGDEFNSLQGGYTWGASGGEGVLRYQLIPTDGTFSRLAIELSDVPGTNPYDFTLIVDGAPTALIATVAADETTGIDLAHTVHVTAGQTVCLKQSAAANPDNTPSARWSIVFESDTPNESIVLACGSASSASVQYCPISHGMNANRDFETDCYQVIPTNGVLKKLYVKLNSDIGTDPEGFTFKLRVNTADSDDGSGNPLAVTIIAENLTGNDTVHEITVAPGDIVGMQITPLETPTVGSTCYWGMVFSPAIDGESLILGSSYDNLTNNQIEYNHLQETALGYGWNTTIKYQGAQSLATLRKFYVRNKAAVGASPDEWVVTIMKTGDATTGIHVHFQSTAAGDIQNDSVNSYTCSDYDRLFIQAEPTDTPASATFFWGLVSYIPTSVVTLQNISKASKLLTDGII